MSKLAFVIGNANYPDPDSALRNSVNDANSIRDRLKILGFDGIIRIDSTNKKMDEGLTEFGSGLGAVDVALFFFAGHGMQIHGKNYLAAIDTDFSTEINAKYSSLPLDKVIEVMEGGANKTSIIILDACRTNPFERRWRGSSDIRGLAPVYAPKGMIIAYATSPGQVALDGAGTNGAFTHALLHHLSTQDITIEDLFKRVRNSLSSSTAGKQISWEHTSLMGDFYFNYSVASDELVAEYSPEALADHSFRAVDHNVLPVLQGLKSHSWYSQNPAMLKLNSAALSSASKDELFILGRNIYQAACGTSSEAMAFLTSLHLKLSAFPPEQSFHLLNGMLFEIYFDSEGRKRQSAKADMIDDIFALEGDPLYSRSFDFVQQALKPYAKELFYIPGSRRDVRVDVTTNELEPGHFGMSGLYFEGDNILYDDKGEYFSPSKDDFLKRVNRTELAELFKKALMTPSQRLKINYVDLPNPPPQELLIPYGFQILRYSKK